MNDIDGWKLSQDRQARWQLDKGDEEFGVNMTVDGNTVSIDKDGALIVVVSTQALVELLKRAGALL